MSDFDWSDQEDVVLPEQPATAVYVNPRGHIVIRQQDDHEDVWIIVQPQNARRLAAAILRAAGDDEALGRLLGSHSEAPSHGDRPKDPTAAERQRRYRERNADRDVTRNADRNGPVTPDRNGHAPLLIEGRA